jgi:hypothetical protein
LTAAADPLIEARLAVVPLRVDATRGDTAERAVAPLEICEFGGLAGDVGRARLETGGEALDEGVIDILRVRQGVVGNRRES